MCVYIRRCLVAVTAVAVVLISQAIADDKPSIPRISASATAPATTSASSTSPSTSSKGQPDYVATSATELASTTNGQQATEAEANSSAATQPSKDSQLERDKNRNDLIKAVPQFSITEVTKPEATIPVEAAQIQHDNGSKVNLKEAESRAASSVKVPEVPKSAQSPPKTESENAKGIPPEGSKDSVPRINASVSETIKPANPVATSTNPRNNPKDNVPQIDVSVSDMIKPVASFSTSTSPEGLASNRGHLPTTSDTRTDPNKPSSGQGPQESIPMIDVSVKNDKSVASSSETAPEPSTAVNPASPSADKEVKDTVPKINAAVSDMIKPVAGSPEATISKPFSSPGEKATPSAAGEGPGQSSTDKVAKVEGIPATSDSSDVTAKKSQFSLSPSGPTEGSKKKTVVIPKDSQPLTTIIKPVHGVNPGGEKPTQSTNITPVSQDLAKQGSNAEVPKDKPLNAYTITSKEFAKKTADAHAKKLEEESEELAKKGSEKLPESPAINSDIPTEQYPATPLKTELKIPPGPEKELASDQKASQLTEQGNVVPSKDEAYQDDLMKTPQEHVDAGTALKSSNQADNVNQLTVPESVNRLADLFESYGKEVVIKWNERREKVSKLGEASEVLQTYSEKIAETRGINDCAANDHELLKIRRKRLKDIIDGCETTLKRNYWHDLQAKTKKKLDELHAIEADYNTQISQIPKDDENFNTHKAIIEANIKRKLLELNAEEIKSEFSLLKDNALKIDEEDYTKCIDNKETKDKVMSIINETRMDIMRIYECV